MSKSGTNEIPRQRLRVPAQPGSGCARSSSDPGSIYKQNNFGATVGGPVYIPKLYNGKNKTFFFGSYEGFRNRNGASSGNFLERADA